MVSEEHNSNSELASEDVPVPRVQLPEIIEELVEEKIDQVGNQNKGRQKKPRLRKKSLFNAILRQMEFYFSDANLSKDRYLGGLVKQDPNVDISIFLRFNKIRNLTDNAKYIAKALRNSTILQVSEDGKKVCRITPIEEKVDIDDCTIYVQRLPQDIDHDKLINLFTEYGPVAYVSIPKFKCNKKIKGFAFIEFKEKADAEKCLKSFRDKGYELPIHTAPNEVMSITTYNEENVPEQTDESVLENQNKADDGIEDTDIDSTSERNEKGKGRKKRKKSQQQDTQSDEIEIKKMKVIKDDIPDVQKPHESKTDFIANITSQNDVKLNKKRRRSTDYEENSAKSSKLKKIGEELDVSKKNQDVEEAPDSEVESQDKEADENQCNEDTDKIANVKKQKRKRKRKPHSGYESPETVSMGMQVMSKRDWKKLRNKYLDLQRKKMSQLKQHLRKNKWNKSSGNDKNKMETDKNEEPNSSSVVKKFEFVPGVIVKIQMLNAPCVDVRNFKNEIKASSNSVKYVDVTEGSFEAYVRCDTAEAANALTQNCNDEKKYTILEGEDEQCYWKKAQQDRENKINKKIRVNQRGRDKLLKKAEKVLGKHIKFEEV